MLFYPQKGLVYGYSIFWANRYFFPHTLAPHRGNHHSVEDFDMTLFHIIGLIIAAILVVYLFIALLKPEWFS